MPPLAVLVALADPTRCRIIEILRGGPQPVHVVAGAFDISRPAISRHLRVLKQARLISEKKVGRENRYALHPARLKPVSDWLDTLAPDTRPADKASAAAMVKKPESAPPPQPIIVTAPQPAPPKPARDKVVSQMGFDF